MLCYVMWMFGTNIIKKGNTTQQSINSFCLIHFLTHLDSTSVIETDPYVAITHPFAMAMS